MSVAQRRRISTLIMGRFARSLVARASGGSVALSRLWPGRTDRLMIAAGNHQIDIVNESLGYRVTRTVQVSPGKVAPIAVKPRHLIRSSHRRVPRAMPRCVSTHLKRLRLRPVRRAPSAWPRLETRQLRTRRARSCSGTARRCGVFSMTAKAARCAHPVYGCVRPYKRYAIRWIVTCKPKKGGCRVAVEPSCWLY